MTPGQFAANEYRDYVVYKELARVETRPGFKKILEELVEHERGDFEFWKEFSSQKEFHVGRWNLMLYVMMRKVLGLTFTARFLEGREKEAVAAYDSYLKTVSDPHIRERIEKIIEHERYHEHTLIENIGETRVKFVSSVVLGLNDGLIELTGAMTGFAFALQSTLVVALAGAITGISASMSMAASAYQQARHENTQEKSPGLAAFFTGTSYLVVVLILIAPFLLIPNTFTALGLMFFFVLAIVVAVSFYSSVLLERRFIIQCAEMLAFSVGVAIVAFILGLGLRELIGVSV
jgi:VIT1/CCC1 family predicted Fe2+/Mn2+ transporter